MYSHIAPATSLNAFKKGTDPIRRAGDSCGFDLRGKFRISKSCEISNTFGGAYANFSTHCLGVAVLHNTFLNPTSVPPSCP